MRVFYVYGSLPKSIDISENMTVNFRYKKMKRIIAMKNINPDQEYILTTGYVLDVEPEDLYGFDQWHLKNGRKKTIARLTFEERAISKKEYDELKNNQKKVG